MFSAHYHKRLDLTEFDPCTNSRVGLVNFEALARIRKLSIVKMKQKRTVEQAKVGNEREHQS